ncbi:PPE family protein [Mycobacterium tuberculosis]|nr:PPE family protein [Mycobacterium tuberculosis]
MHLRETVNLGPIHIDPIHVHIPPLLDIDQTIDLGSFTVAPITVAPIALDYHETFDLGPLVIFPPMNIPATVIESFSTAPGGPAPRRSSFRQRPMCLSPPSTSRPVTT